jgi:hypothetical protein
MSIRPTAVFVCPLKGAELDEDLFWVHEIEEEKYLIESFADWEEVLSIKEFNDLLQQFLVECQAAGLQPEIGITTVNF